MERDFASTHLSTPPRRSWFAVWRWKWWVWTAVIPLIAFAYFLSAAPIEFLLLKTGVLYSHQWVLTSCQVAFSPVHWCIDRFDTAGWVWMWEWAILEELEMMFEPHRDESLSPQTIRL